MSITIKGATLELAEEIIKVINWAYRGKEGVECWTGEKEYISGIRMSFEDLVELIQKQKDDHMVLFVALLNEKVVGTIKAEKIDTGSQLSAEFGLFSVDPSHQSHGIGGKLLDCAEEYAKSKWSAEKGIMWLLEMRHDLFQWYSKRGYLKTGRKEPFPVGANCGEPRMPLQFDVLECIFKHSIGDLTSDQLKQ